MPTSGNKTSLKVKSKKLGINIILELASLLGLKPDSLRLQNMAGDVSSRRFYRLLDATGSPRSLVAMVYSPSSTGEISKFEKISQLLNQASIPAPEIVALDQKSGLIVVDDLGDMLLEQVPKSSQLYLQAIKLLIRFQLEVTPPTPPLNPDFDHDTFSRELELFRTTILGKQQVSLTPIWDDFFEMIIEDILTQPKFFCHRDYHCRNLIWEKEELSMVDFQDARIGPYTYDLVSLLYDPYTALKKEQIARLIEYFFCHQPRIESSISPEKFRQDCDMMLIQRMLKAVGTYGWVFRDRGDSSYLGYIEPARKALMGAMKRNVKLSCFLPLLDKWDLT